MLRLDAHAPRVEAYRRELAGTANLSSADGVYAHVLARTGSEEEAQAAVLAWRTARAESGREVS